MNVKAPLVAALLAGLVVCTGFTDQHENGSTGQRDKIALSPDYISLKRSNRYSDLTTKCLGGATEVRRIGLSGYLDGGGGDMPPVFSEYVPPGTPWGPSFIHGAIFMDSQAEKSAKPGRVKSYMSNYPWFSDAPPIKIDFTGWVITLGQPCRGIYVSSHMVLIDHFPLP